MANKVIQTLVTELTADGAKLKKEMDSSLKQAKTWGERISKITSSIAIGGLAAGGTLSVGLAALTKSAINNADAFDEQSQRVNIATEDLSAYAYQAKFAGVSNEELNGALVKFNKTTAEAVMGVGKGADAFEQLGISVNNTDGTLKTNSELLGEIADRFSVLEDGPIKTSLAMDIFGKSVGAKLVPMLNGGTAEMKLFREEAERMGLIVSSETAAAAGELNDNLDKMSLALQGLGMRIATEALPSLNEFTDVINDPSTQAGLASFATGIIEIGTAAVGVFAELGKLYRLLTDFDDQNLVHINEQIELVKSAIESPTERLRFFGKDGLIEYYSEDELKSELTKLMSQAKSVIDQNEFKGELDDFGWGDVFNPIPTETGLPDPNKSGKSGKKNKSKLVLAGSDEWKIQQQQEINAMLEQEKREREAADREVAIQRDKFTRIHEEALSAQGKQVELENFRYELEKEQMDAEYNALSEHKLLTLELEDEFIKARQEQEITHQERLKEIKDRAAEQDAQRQQLQLAAAENLFGSLGDIAKKFSGENSKLYKALFLTEKAISIARSIMAIKTGIALAAANPFPANLGAMVTVAGATGSLLSDIQSTSVAGIAHGGLENVPSESTYFLDKGERVLSPLQNRDLTQYLDQENTGRNRGFKVEVINNTGSGQFSAAANMLNENTMQIILTAVDSKLQQDLGNGRGVWLAAQRRFGWPTKGSV
jgi:hypothetical protein